MERPFRDIESFVKLGVLAFCLMLMWTGRRYPENARLFPDLLGGVTIFLILFSFVLDLVKPKGKKSGEEEREIDVSDTSEEKLKLVKEMEEKGEEGDAGYELLEEGLRKRRLYQGLLIIFVSLISFQKATIPNRLSLFRLF